MINKAKLVEAMECELESYWKGSTLYNTWTKAIALVKKHCEGEGDEVLTLLRNFVEIMRGQKDANVNWIALVDLAKVARSLIDSDKPAEDPQKGCWSCKRHIAGRGCYKTCNPPVWEAWKPKPTGDNIIKLHKRTPEEVSRYLIDKYALQELRITALEQANEQIFARPEIVEEKT